MFLGKNLQGFLDRQHGQQRGVLKLDSDLVLEDSGSRLALVKNITRGRFENVFDHFEGRGLAGPVRPQQPKTDAFRDAETDIIHGHEITVLLAQMADFQDGRHERWSPAVG